MRSMHRSCTVVLFPFLCHEGHVKDEKEGE